MSEYYLADRKSEERKRERDGARAPDPQTPKQAQDIKVTMLGDFLFPSAESHGCDPYNSTQGRPVRDAWKARRDRR